MGTLRSRSFVLIICGLLLVVLQISLWVVIPARADVGPEPILPAGSNLKAEYQTPIEMQAEKVILNVRAATEVDNSVVAWDAEGYGFDVWFPAIAEVEADFTMLNPTNDKVSTTVWFPLALALEDDRWLNHPDAIVPAIQRFQILVKGKPVEYAVIDLPNPKGADRPPLPWASFPVTFPAKGKMPIKVSYLLPAQRPEAKWKGLIMEFGYIFQTGAGWAGPIGKAVLEVNLPYPASPETIVEMPGGAQVDGNRVRWTWENFEPGPANDFSISLMQPEPWQSLKAARVAVQADPKDGQAWVQLCDTYFGLGYSGWHKNPGFGEVFPALGLEACQEAAGWLSESEPDDGQAWLDLCATYYSLSEGEGADPSVAVPACQEAARLLPKDAAAHYGLAVLYLTGLSENPSAEQLQPVLDELKLGQELEAVQPPSSAAMWKFFFYESPVDYITDWVNRLASVPTATAPHPSQTQAVISSSTARPSSTPAPAQPPTRLPTRLPSASPQPLPSAVATATALAATPTDEPAATSTPQGIRTGSLPLIAVAGVILMISVVYLILKRRV
jgi:hypothetical protein